ncbi:MAG TPA: hypothetical protein VKW76_08235 [Candidatus Binatia bacterium]|nr:hypothetical protein [Candidatus Binatia bacterium]
MTFSKTGCAFYEHGSPRGEGLHPSPPWGGAALLAFLVAELLRTPHGVAATRISMAAWLLYLLSVIWWLRGRSGWAAFLKRSARVGLLGSSAFCVLFLYYHHSRVLDAGVHVDAAYTFLGLRWFVDSRNPITFVGATPSYYQPSFALLSHLPGLLVGFERIGAAAVPLGLMVQVALLLGAATERLAARPLGYQVATAALAAAVFSNRMLVLCYDKVGYAVPAICLGLMFCVAVDERALSPPFRPIGAALALSILHYITGLVIVLPLCTVWLLLSRTPLRRLRVFLAENPVLLTAFGIFGVTVAIHPDLVLQRVRDVSGLGPPPRRRR